MIQTILFPALAGLLLLIAQSSYIIAIIRGQTRPSRASWVIWTALTWLGAAAMYASGALNVQMAMFCIGDAIIILLAIPFGAPGWSKVDIAALVSGAVGVVFWVLTKNPLYGLGISMAVNAIASIPTYVKTWHAPEHEDLTAWVLVSFSSFFQTLAIPAWTVADALQPILFVLLQVPMVLLILRPRLFATA